MYRVDLTGQIFGMLTVLSVFERDKNGVLFWTCQCSCGNIINTRHGSLQSGRTKSCGCLRKEITSKKNKKDLVGQKFNRLTVIKEVGISGRGSILWECLCDCGNIINVAASSLQSGNTKSCGCLQVQKATATLTEVNSKRGNIGATPLNKHIRSLLQYKIWRGSIFKRDFFRCCICNKVGGNLHAHHIKSFASIKARYNITTLEDAINCNELWDINNGVTLCARCHYNLHKEIKNGG